LIVLSVHEALDDLHDLGLNVFESQLREDLLYTFACLVSHCSLIKLAKFFKDLGDVQCVGRATHEIEELIIQGFCQCEQDFLLVVH